LAWIVAKLLWSHLIIEDELIVDIAEILPESYDRRDEDLIEWTRFEVK
jgi:hypothetical protein